MSRLRSSESSLATRVWLGNRNCYLKAPECYRYKNLTSEEMLVYQQIKLSNNLGQATV